MSKRLDVNVIHSFSPFALYQEFGTGYCRALFAGTLGDSEYLDWTSLNWKKKSTL